MPRTDGDDDDRYFLSDSVAGAMLMKCLLQGETLTRQKAGRAIYPRTTEEWLSLDANHRRAFEGRAFRILQAMSRWLDIFSEPDDARTLKEIESWTYFSSGSAQCSIDDLRIKRKHIGEFL